ncbi:MAG: type I 3-dehydroquinate dehydratase [Candidatus Caldarchaeum sp.]|nr:type I 3-dehydroquinate dehydratase [Candidatus Caldarchaeum sp.]
MKTLICASVFGKDEDELVERVSQALGRGADLVEVRLDLSNYTDVDRLCSVLGPFSEKLVVTCRPVEEGGKSTLPKDERLNLLEKLAEMGVGYVDVELKIVDDDAAARLKKLCRRLIVSWHNFETTPDTMTLVDVGRKCLRHGDIAKIVTFSRGAEDNYRLLGVYSFLPRTKVVAFCMGEEGWITRVLSMAAGAPIAYASLDELRTAPGQLRVEEMVAMRDSIVQGVAGD